MLADDVKRFKTNFDSSGNTLGPERRVIWIYCTHTSTTDINTRTSCPCQSQQWREMFDVHWDVWESERLTYYWPPPRAAPPGIVTSGKWSPFPPALWHFCRARARHRKTPLLYPMPTCPFYRSCVRFERLRTYGKTCLLGQTNDSFPKVLCFSLQSYQEDSWVSRLGICSCEKGHRWCWPEGTSSLLVCH